MQANKMELELVEQQQQLEQAACCLQRTHLQHQAQLAELQREHEQRYMAVLRQQQAAAVEQQSDATAMQQALQQGSVAAAAAALLGRQLGGNCSSSSQQVVHQPSYAGIAATIAAVFGGPTSAPAAATSVAKPHENCTTTSSSKSSCLAPVKVAQAAAAAAAAAVGVSASPKARPAGPQLSELMACLAEMSGSNPQLSQHPELTVQQHQEEDGQQEVSQQQAGVIMQQWASPQASLVAQDEHQSVQQARQSSQGYQAGVAVANSRSDVSSQCQATGSIAAEDSEVSPSKLQAKLAAYRSYLKHASPTKSSAAAAAVTPSSSSEGGGGMRVNMQHPGSFHSQSDGGVQMQRSSEDMQHWPAVNSMSDGGVVLHSPAGPAVVAEPLAAQTAGTALQAPSAAAEEVAESTLDEASSTRTSDDSWGTASNACSRAGSLQHRQLSSSMSVTSSFISMKRQSLQDSGQLKGLASYARFAAAAAAGLQPQPEAAARSAAHSADLGVPRQLGTSCAVRTRNIGRVSSSSSSRRGSQLSSSCSALAGLDKRRVRAEIAAAGGMAAIVEQFSSSLFENAGGDTAPGSAAAGVESWAREPAALAVDSSAASSVDVLPLESGASRAARTKKQHAVCSLSASGASASASLLAGDNSTRMYDQVELVQQQQQQQQGQKSLRRSQAAASNSNRTGW
jgi:hypothetical protein